MEHGLNASFIFHFAAGWEEEGEETITLLAHHYSHFELDFDGTFYNASDPELRFTRADLDARFVDVGFLLCSVELCSWMYVHERPCSRSHHHHIVSSSSSSSYHLNNKPRHSAGHLYEYTIRYKTGDGAAPPSVAAKRLVRPETDGRAWEFPQVGMCVLRRCFFLM